MWKVPTTTVGNDNPPPYSTRNDSRPLVDDERQESMGKYQQFSISLFMF